MSVKEASTSALNLLGGLEEVSFIALISVMLHIFRHTLLTLSSYVGQP